MFEDKKILIIAAHIDDIEMGMGATLSQIKKYDPFIVVFSDKSNQYPEWNLREEMKNSMAVLGLNYIQHDYTIDDFDNNRKQIRDKIYSHRGYDVVFSNSPLSQHMDHRIIGESVADIFLETTVLYWEDIRSGQHEKINFWNPINPAQLATKYRMMDCYGSQKALRHYFTEDAIATMARFRGGQIKQNYAESFEVGRIVL